MDIRSAFLKDLRQAAVASGDPLHRTYLKWYLATAYGPGAKWEVTDGPSDGGIDAIVSEQRTRGGVFNILQSKFHEGYLQNRESPLPLADYNSFDRIPTIFRNDSVFDDWIKTVESGLRNRYRNLRKMLSSEGAVVNWQLITLHTRSRKGENRLQNLTPDSFVYGAQNLQLFEMSQEGATPPADPLELTFTNSMIVEDPDLPVVSYVFAAKLKDFIDFMDHDAEERLFARNVRLDLRSRINRSIRETFEKAPHEFWGNVPCVVEIR